MRSIFLFINLDRHPEQSHRLSLFLLPTPPPVLFRERKVSSASSRRIPSLGHFARRAYRGVSELESPGFGEDPSRSRLSRPDCSCRSRRVMKVTFDDACEFLGVSVS